MPINKKQQTKHDKSDLPPTTQSKLSLGYPSMRRNWSQAQSLSFFHTGLGGKLSRNDPKELQNYS